MTPAVVTGADHAEPAPCPVQCPELACQLEAGRCLLDASKPQEAKALLKPFVDEHPKSVPLQLLLAKSYWAMGNVPWTRRVLGAARQERPDSCEIRSWQIWVALKTAALDQAEALLAEPGCPDSPLMEGRWALYRGVLARYQERPQDATAAALAAYDRDALYAEDLPLLMDLATTSAPALTAPSVRIRVEVGGGYTTNGMMSTPVDVAAAGQDTSSPLLSTDVFLGFELPRFWARPVIELTAKAVKLTDDEVADFSYFSLGGRFGVGLGPLKAFYASQAFLLEGGDLYSAGDARWFYETHRGEVEVEPTPWLTLWGGAGRSLFRERIRSRTELDGGGAVAFSAKKLRMLTGLSLRRHWAESQAYDLWGGMALVSATHPLGPLTARARLILSFDLYPDSMGAFEPDEERRDLLLRGGVELWSPPLQGVRVGAAYEVSDRISSAELYEYVDHRVLVQASIGIDFDPWTPRAVPPHDQRVTIPYGVGQGEEDALEDERIQDILRQEDAARRGSSCVN